VGPSGIYVLNDAGNGRPASEAYDPGMLSSSAYRLDVTGAAIFVPLREILPSIKTWGRFDWDWSYVNTLVHDAVSTGKRFSIALEVGYGDALPDNFSATCGLDCAPPFHVWTTGGAKQGTCLTAEVPIPWVKNMQEFWKAALVGLAADLHHEGTYGSLTLVHVPGVSVYDEELRLPSGMPAAPSGTCSGSSSAALNQQWRGLGYSDDALESGFIMITRAAAQAFPGTYLGLSLYPPTVDSNALAFPNGNAQHVAEVSATLVQDASRIAPGRLELQSDDLDTTSATITPKVIEGASKYRAVVGWQSNERGGTGAACGAHRTPCADNGSSTSYLQLLANGAKNHGVYVEVWSHDVASYPNAFATAIRDHLFPAPQPSLAHHS
jgi:hypothetical protein